MTLLETSGIFIIRKQTQYAMGTSQANAPLQALKILGTWQCFRHPRRSGGRQWTCLQARKAGETRGETLCPLRATAPIFWKSKTYRYRDTLFCSEPCEIPHPRKKVQKMRDERGSNRTVRANTSAGNTNHAQRGMTFRAIDKEIKEIV